MKNSPGNSKELFLRLLSYAFNYKLLFVVSLLGFILYNASQTLLLRSLELLINTLEGKTTEWVSIIPIPLEQNILFVPIIVLILSFFRGIGFYFGNFFISVIGLHVINDLRKEVFDHLLYLPQKFFDEKNSGEQISLIIFNIEQVSASVTKAVKVIFEDGLFVVGILTLLLFMNWKLTLVFFAVAPVLSGLVLIAARYFRRVSRKIQATVGRVSHITNETVQGIQTVKSFNAEKAEAKRFHSAADENLLYKTKYERVNALQTPITNFVIAIALSTIFLLVLIFWPEGDAAGAVTFVASAGAMAKPIKQLSTINAIIQKGLAAAETIFATIDEEKELDMGTASLDTVSGEINFNKVKFQYNDEKVVLRELSFAVAAGETIALVGHSGSGKTTIASLLLRLYNPQSGQITIDGLAIDQLPLHDLRDKISLVSQSAVLFDASIQENVCYGSKEIDTDKLMQALSNANALGFVEQLEDGVNSMVGEAGSRLSGGQRQRIAIARALYKDSPILILDEATSALDNESEKQIQEALETLKHGRTTLVIAHRLSTVRNADKIIVLDRGDIIEMGNHAELINRNGAYAKLYNMQSELT